MLLTSLIVFHVLLCIFLTIVVLLQFGKGAETGAVMGTSGASQNIFSSSSKGNVVTKATTVMAIMFVVNSLVLARLMKKENTSSIMDNEEKVIQLQREEPTPTSIPSATKAESENSTKTVPESTEN